MMYEGLLEHVDWVVTCKLLVTSRQCRTVFLLLNYDRQTIAEGDVSGVRIKLRTYDIPPVRI